MAFVPFANNSNNNDNNDNSNNNNNNNNNNSNNNNNNKIILVLWCSGYHYWTGHPTLDINQEILD